MRGGRFGRLACALFTGAVALACSAESEPTSDVSPGAFDWKLHPLSEGGAGGDADIQAQCLAAYPSENFPPVYQSSPAECAPGYCTQSFADFCAAPSPKGGSRQGVGVRLCTAALPCVEQNGQLMGGSPAPCPCTGPTCPNGCNSPGPSCGCTGGALCSATGVCVAPTCDGGAPTYPPPSSTPPIILSLGYDLPDDWATWACGYLVAIPYAGPLLFTVTGGLGAHGSLQAGKTTSWQATCKRDTSSTLDVGVKVNLCGLNIDGTWAGKDATTEQFCLTCSPNPACGTDLACETKSSSSTKQVTIAKTFRLTSANASCSIDSGSGGRRWLDWLKRNIDVTATAGGGWTGTKKVSTTSPGPAAKCDPSCVSCKTTTDGNAIFVQLGGTATLTTPTWRGISGSAYVNLTGRAGVGLSDTVSSCSGSCSSKSASASVTLTLGASVGAFGLRAAAAVGCTCSYSKTWSDCPNGSNTDVPNGCRWSTVLDPGR